MPVKRRINNNQKQIIKSCINVAIKTAKTGSLFVIDFNIEPNKRYYIAQMPKILNEDGNPFNILNEMEQQVIKALAEVGGAVIVDNYGYCQEYGTKLKKEASFFEYDKKHAYARGTSKMPNVICILASERDRHVRTFREGVCITDMDSGVNMPPTVTDKVIELLDTPLSKILVGTGIAAASILTLNPIPAIITISGSTVIISYGFDKLKSLFK